MSNSPTERTKVHLIILIHGLYGSPANVAVIGEEVHKAAAPSSSPLVSAPLEPSSSAPNGAASFSTPRLRKWNAKGKGKERDYGVASGGEEDNLSDLEVVTYALKSFTGSKSWDGIDVNGHRAAKELGDEIARLDDEGKEVWGISIVCPVLCRMLSKRQRCTCR